MIGNVIIRRIHSPLSLQMRATALSDDTIINLVNENFIPLAINVTQVGFPSDVIPALAYVEVGSREFS